MKIDKSHSKISQILNLTKIMSLLLTKRASLLNFYFNTLKLQIRQFPLKNININLTIKDNELFSNEFRIKFEIFQMIRKLSLNELIEEFILLVENLN